MQIEQKRSESQNRADKEKKKKKEAIGEFYDTKEKQVLKDEVIMAEKKVRENEGEGISGHLE